MDTKLAAYLERTGLSHREFAAKAGIPNLHPMVSLWARARARPGGWSAIAIERATEGEIPAAYWRSIPARKNKRARRSRKAD